MSEDVKPCPFCNAAPVLEDERTIWVVRCECGACVLGERAPEPNGTETSQYWDGIRQTAVAAWNRRAGQQGEARPARAEVERLESIIHDALWTGRTKPSSAQVALDQLAALATQAAPEAQAEPAGEPVAWGAQEDPKCRYDGKDACIDCLMQGDCMARPAASGERDTLRALLREARDEVKWWVDEHSCCSGVEALALVARIDAALADGRAK